MPQGNWLYFIVAFLAVAGWVIALSRRSLVVLAPWRRVTVTGLRLLVLLLLLAAVFEIHWSRKRDELAVIFVLDISESVSQSARQWAVQYLRAAAEQMTPKDLAGLILFGEEAYVDIAPGRREEFLAGLDSMATRPDPSSTNLASAIRLAVALIPEGARRRVVLLSDGEENLGSAQQEARSAAAGDVQIHTVALDTRQKRETLIDRLLVPERVREGSPFDVRLFVESTHDTPAAVRFFRDGHYMGTREVQLSEGKNVFSFPQEIEQSGFHTFEARLEAARDDRAENNKAAAFSYVQGPPRILYLVESAGSSPPPVVRSLRREAMQVDLLPASAAPVDIAGLQAYDALVLDNVSAMGFSGRLMRAIERYVHDLGGGLVMIGGENSFAPGGYLGTPVEEALPVEMEIKSKRHFPSFAQVIVIDKSGSMGMTAPSGKQKIELAGEGAIAAVGLLTGRDSIGVLAVDTRPKWVSPLRKASQRESIVSDIATLRAGGGGIYVYTGLKEAHLKLSSTPAAIRHIILFADGADSEQQEGVDQLVEQMAEQNITVSCVSLGQGRDVPFLESLAQQAGGRFHLTEDVDQVPRVFARETILAQRSYFIEEVFQPQLVTPSPVIRGLVEDQWPPLSGYVGTTIKPRAELILATHKDDPLLAGWRHGLGKAVAFTSDAQARWASDWIGWEGFGKFWTQMIRWVQRSSDAGHLQSRLEVSRGEGRLIVDALDNEGNYLNFLQLEATVLSPSLERREVQLTQSAPGRYEARFPARGTGIYMASVIDNTAGSPRQGSQQVSGTAIAYPAEFRPGGSGPLTLRRIAETSGGNVLEEESELGAVFRHDLPPQRAVVSLWQDFLLIALVLLPLDIALRRITISADQRQALARVFLFRRTPAPATGRDATLSQLKGVKEETRTRLEKRTPGAAEEPAGAGSPEWMENMKRPEKTAEPEQQQASSTPGTSKGDTLGPKHDKTEPEAKSDEKSSTYSRLLEAKKRVRKHS